MANKNAETLIAAVRALPPSRPSVVGEFANKLFAVANDDGTVEDAKAFEIVDNWPGAGDTCKEDFLRNNGIPKPVKGVLFGRVGTFVDQGENADWLYGVMSNREDNSVRDAIFPDGQKYADYPDKSFAVDDGSGRTRLMDANDGVLVNVEALNAATVSTEVKVANDGAAWAIFRTSVVWDGDRRSPWTVAIKLS